MAHTKLRPKFFALSKSFTMTKKKHFYLTFDGIELKLFERKKIIN